MMFEIDSRGNSLSIQKDGHRIRSCEFVAAAEGYWLRAGVFHKPMPFLRESNLLWELRRTAVHSCAITQRQKLT